MTTVSNDTKAMVDKLFATGAHYGYSKARRHPSAQKFIFGAKNGVDIFDLEKSVEALADVESYVKGLAQVGKQILFVGGKLEAQGAIRRAGEAIDQPFVAGRYVGGTLSNFALIRKRVEKLMTLMDEREKGTLVKYTKKERLMIDRDIKRLETTFGGLRPMRSLPGAVFVVDPKHEKNVVREAMTLRIPIIALANSDCDVSKIAHVIPGNDASVHSIAFFVDRLVESYREGAKDAPKIVVPEAPRSRTRDDAPHSRAPRRERALGRSQTGEAPRA
ncbi:MAG: 30S ribosomal protein S2 [Patescibacteria group bacterium]